MAEIKQHIGLDLWDAVQRHQGKAFVSDGVDAVSEREYVEIVRDVVLPHSRAALRKINAWYKKHEHLLNDAPPEARP